MRLVEYPYVVVRIGCNLCSRKGAYRLARLAVAYGPEIDMDELVRKVAKDCPWRPHDYERSRSQYKPTCHAHLVDLVGGPPPDLPPSVAGLRVIEGGKAADEPVAPAIGMQRG